MALTNLQHRFAEQMIAEPTISATEAYKRAGGRARGHAAEQQASRMVRNGEVRAVIEAGRARALDQAGVSAQRTLVEVARVAYADPRTLFHPDGRFKLPSEWDDATAAIVAGLDVEEKRIQLGRAGRGKGKGRKGRAATVRTIRVRLNNKVAALSLAADLQGLVKQRHELSGPNGGPVPVSVRPGPDLSKLSDEELGQLERLLTAAGAGPEPGTDPRARPRAW